ncbi:hypothetical protein ACWD8L_04165 [Streptomyces sp. NPDC005133]
MLDGRQVAVLAALTSGAVPAATALVHETCPGEPWEQVVTDYLALVCRLAGERSAASQIQDLTDTYVDRLIAHGATVFHTRLGLALLDVTDSPRAPTARKVVAELFHDSGNG